MTPARRRAQRGFSLLEILVAGTILVIGILGHAASVLASHKMARTTADQGDATQTLGRFVERLRADPDWAGLYARLRSLSAESVSDSSLAYLSVDETLTTYPASSYYSDFTVPSDLGTVTFLVQVPSTAISGVAALRESATAPRYGLPHDLNGDGVVDANSRNSDYRVLPAVVRIRWQRSGQRAHEVVLATLLRGER
jgi:type II secretory pathway pseudopilin PulG